ncbi:hypothetical protein [Arthrobacter bambusae]|uniref:hypothetical protein n=1 Tax=Arthrobacter bambusae TaxID=1338426 RepID=UPI0027884273|nr:hypothetical protein [Arthrobacter bambusae]MDQ0030173.1 hypothetical protein [Arthrobacter bambusae]MDQ0097855.1 hypothetical protein [Arthrobacter bambusae]
MSFTYPAMVAYDPIGKQPVKNVSFQAYATTDTGFTTPLTISDPFGNPIPGNILNSGTFGVFPQFQHASLESITLADASRTYTWTVPALQQDQAVANYINRPGSATQAALSATYATPAQAAGTAAALSIVFGG